MDKIVDKLLLYFASESGHDISDIFCDDLDYKRKLLRSYINVRPPKEISDEILELEDRLLELEFAQEDITFFKNVDSKVLLWHGDITTLRIDAIVNAANFDGLGCFIPNHGCIDNQIHTYAGIRLRLECNELLKNKKLDTSSVLLTSAHNLPSKYIVHTVGPIIDGEVSVQDEIDLEMCYKNVLDICKENNIRTVAFPCISTGVFSFPSDRAAFLAYNHVKKYLEENSDFFDYIVFNVFTVNDKEIYEKLFKS